MTTTNPGNTKEISSFKVAIVGAGIAGLRCGQVLCDHGMSVELFDKGRGLGGRVATRRTEPGLAFDHGAQYFTASKDIFIAQAESWVARGIAAEWLGKVVKLSQSDVADCSPRRRYVGVPGMSALGTDLARNLDVRREKKIKRVTFADNVWTLFDQDGIKIGSFDFLVVTLPSPQTAELLKDYPLGRYASSVSMSPCWAVMAAFSDRVDVPWDGAFVEDAALSWVARNNSKPSRPQTPECWVLHASPDFSSANIEDLADKIAATLIDTFGKLARIQLPATIYLAAHRWRYSQASSIADSSCRFDLQTRLALCGDWLAGGKVEGAYISGESAARWIVQAVKH
jgi:renalase